MPEPSVSPSNANTSNEAKKIDTTVDNGISVIDTSKTSTARPPKGDSGKPFLSDGDRTWSRVPYQVRFGKQFESLEEVLAYQTGVTDYQGKEDINAGIVKGSIKDSLMAASSAEGIAPSRGYYKDSRVGANDAVNCIWQFNKDDDIVYPLMMTEKSGSNNGYYTGMGRVYAATQEQNQTIAWFTFGVPKFTNLAKFYEKAIEPELVKLHHTGVHTETSNLVSSLMKGIIQAGAMAITLPIQALGWFLETGHSIIRGSKEYDTPSRFYSLRTTMFQYYRYVDSILSHWLVDTGIYGSIKDGGSSDSLPLTIRTTGSSIFQILATKARLAGVRHMNEQEYYTSVSHVSGMTPDAFDTDNKETDGWSDAISDWGNVFAHSALGATQFIGFRVEKGVDASESFSNSTKPNEFAEQINQQIQKQNQTLFNLGGVGEAFGDAVNSITSAVGGLLGAAGFDGAGASITGIASAVTGGVQIDIPESYQGSDFNKSHSLNFQLRSPYGDVASIYQSIMIPLACLLAGALPRASGANSYQQPFLCRVYCKGLFAIPLGIIDSLSIKRGSSEFGWTYQNLPTCIDVSISIKDMAPIMAMAMAVDKFEGVFGTDSPFHEYMLTLAGTGLYERLSKYQKFKRRLTQNLVNLRNTVFNPWFHNAGMADSNLVTFVSGLIPSTRLPKGQ